MNNFIKLITYFKQTIQEPEINNIIIPSKDQFSIEKNNIFKNLKFINYFSLTKIEEEIVFTEENNIPINLMDYILISPKVNSVFFPLFEIKTNFANSIPKEFHDFLDCKLVNISSEKIIKPVKHLFIKNIINSVKLSLKEESNSSTDDTLLQEDEGKEDDDEEKEDEEKRNNNKNYNNNNKRRKVRRRRNNNNHHHPQTFRNINQHQIIKDDEIIKEDEIIKDDEITFFIYNEPLSNKLLLYSLIPLKNNKNIEIINNKYFVSSGKNDKEKKEVLGIEIEINLSTLSNYKLTENNKIKATKNGIIQEYEIYLPSFQEINAQNIKYETLKIEIKLNTDIVKISKTYLPFKGCEKTVNSEMNEFCQMIASDRINGSSILSDYSD